MMAIRVLGGAIVTAVAAATSPIGLDVDFPAFLARSDPTWRWGSSAANRTRRPEEWVESLFGGNGDLGFMLWSPEPALLRLEVSKKSLWDDRTPDLVTPPSVLARNKTYYTNDFAHDQPRLPSGHFELTWGSKKEAPILAVGRVDLHAARAALDVTTTASGGGFGVRVWACAAYDVADVVVVETWGVGDGDAPDVVWVPANLTRERCSRCLGDPPFEAPAWKSSGAFRVRTNLARPLAIRGAATFEELGGDVVEIAGLAPSETAALYSARAPPATFAFSPLAGCPAEFNHWGMVLQSGGGPCALPVN